jgi:hypothetical protein
VHSDDTPTYNVKSKIKGITTLVENLDLKRKKLLEIINKVQRRKKAIKMVLDGNRRWHHLDLQYMHKVIKLEGG